MAPKYELLSEYLRQQKCDDAEEEEKPSWRNKPLHGMYHQQIDEVVDIKKTYQWLEKAGLKDSTEALIMAAQEQELSTRSVEAGIYHTRQDPRWRLCKDVPETVQHIIDAEKMQAGAAYMECHNQVVAQCTGTSALSMGWRS